MRLTLFKYISREIWSVFFVSLSIFIFIIMATRIMGITELLINQRVYPTQVIKILLCFFPKVILFSLPAACLMCVLLSFLRLSSDNEVIALHSSGLSLYQLLPAVVVFSLIIFLLSILISGYAIPWGGQTYKKVLYQIVSARADAVIKERVFLEPFHDVVLYINNYSTKDKIMKDLFVVDKRDDSTTSTIIAKKGRIFSGNETGIVIIYFMDGTIFTVDRYFNRARTVTFDTYNMTIDLKKLLSSYVSKEKKPEEMSLGELIDELRDKTGDNKKQNQVGIRLFEIFSIPVAIFLLGIIGAPLGAHVRASGRTKGIIISLILFLFYYLFIMFVRYLCEIRDFPPSITVWIPDLFLLFAAFYLLRRIANDRPLKFTAFFSLKPGSDLEPINEKNEIHESPIAIESCKFIGSLKGKKVHLDHCRWADKISPENKVFFKSYKDAVDKGYSPCNTCKPD
ncbi:MAG: LptF/LptG family permease [Deltaproteobacteria bacterium]|nr:LptF/LptG family permease [Deltaproteobacteria bacterium]